MPTKLRLRIHTQPDDFTCGPTCLHALYQYYGDPLPLEAVVAEVPRVQNGGTLSVFLALHAMRRGYGATIYTYNLNLFDPTWFDPDGPDLRARMRLQALLKPDEKLRHATEAYVEFVDRGGQLRMQDLTAGLIGRYIRQGQPMIAGLSATYLYGCARESEGPTSCEYDDAGGIPQGHFVILSGYDPRERVVTVVDPQCPNPFGNRHVYHVSVDRAICAILLGIVTYDAKLLVLHPPGDRHPGDSGPQGSMMVETSG